MNDAVINHKELIQIPIEGGHKKKNIASCGFGTLVNRIQVVNIAMDENTLKKEFLKQSNPVSRIFKKIWRNTFGTTPKSLASGLDRILKDKNKPYKVEMMSGLSLEDITKILAGGQPIMVMYSRQQTHLYFHFRYPHYALLVGLDGVKQTVKLLDPNTGKTEEILFKLWREQFELQSHHSGPLFTFAKKIGIMRPRTGIYLKKIL